MPRPFENSSENPPVSISIDGLEDFMSPDENVGNPMEGNSMASTRGPQSFKVFCHGGRCCGVKHIHSIPATPDIKLAEYKGKTYHIGGAYAQMVNPGQYFTYKPYPAETALERFDKVLAHIKTCQPGGLIEAVLTNAQKEKWGQIFKDKGFTEGPTWKNSNTSTKLTMYWKINISGY